MSTHLRDRRATAEIIIIGGGLMGTAAAFFLRKRGRSVILLERRLAGQEASGVNFGNVRRQGRYFSQLPLANRARAIWGKLPELIGEDCEFNASGHMRVCYTAEQAAKVEAYAREARTYDLELEILGARDLHARFPYIGPEALMGSLAPQDGHANPRLVAPAFARAARREGASIIENTAVLSVEKVGGDFLVETHDQGEFRAPALLVTAGAWAGSIAARFGEPVPLVARGPQMGVTEPVPYRIKPSLGVSSPLEEEIVYLRQVTRGNIVFGGGRRNTVDLDGKRVSAHPENTLRQMPQLQRLLPEIGQLRLIRTWSGIEGYLPDDLPIMSASDKVSGLFYAFGFCGAGFQIGPGVGDVMAELIDTGRTATPIEPLHIRRFAATQST